MSAIINGKVAHSQDISDFEQTNALQEKLLPHVYSLDAINSLLLEFTAKLNEEEDIGATIDDYRDYSKMSIPALQARIRKLREDLPENLDISFLDYQKEGLKYFHYSHIPYSSIKDINQKRGINFDKYLSKFANKNSQSEITSEDGEIDKTSQDCQYFVSSSTYATEIDQDTNASNTNSETTESDESNNPEYLDTEAHQKASLEAKDSKKESFVTSISNSIDLEKTIAVVLAEIVMLKQEIAHLKQENSDLKSEMVNKLSEQQEHINQLEQQIKDGTNKKIADTLDQLLELNRNFK